MFRFIGFPPEDDERLKQWCLDRKSFSWGYPTGQEQADIAEKMVAYWRYCCDFVALRRNHRADDFASELLDAHDADNEDLTYREVESIVHGLSFAGHEAVTSLLNNFVMTLLRHPDQWTALCNDPRLVTNAWAAGPRNYP